MTTTAGQSYATAPNRLMHASNGIDYAYREIGTGTIPLVLLQHFRGNLENWDPPLLDALASERRVTAFDNVGIGATTGTTPNTMEQMAHDALFFIDALEVPQVDILGFSIGSFVAQEIALTRPDVVRRLVLASSAPRGGAGMHGWAPEVINAVGRPEPDPGGYLDVFFTSSPASRQAGQEALGRIYGRTVDVDEFASWSSRLAQYDAVCDWGIPNHAALQRVSAISHPVFIANGDSDPMILPHFSYLLAGLIPKPKSKSTPTLPTGSCSSTPPSSPPTSTHSSTTASQIKPKLLQIRAMTCEPTLLPAGQDNPSRSGRQPTDRNRCWADLTSLLPSPTRRNSPGLAGTDSSTTGWTRIVNRPLQMVSNHVPFSR